MFGWRKKQIAEQVAKDIGDLPEVATPVAETPEVNTLDSKNAEYTVGVNQAGNTQLRIQLDYGSATLTLAPDAVRRLIRQLEVTLDDSDD